MLNLTDLKLRLQHNELRPVYTVAENVGRIPNTTTTIQDLETISGKDNLAQAIVMRLLTPRGELTPLGHTEYGSRLHELIGRPNNETTHNLAKVYILDALGRESRIAKVLSLDIAPHPGTRDQIDILLNVQPVGEVQSLTIGPLLLDLGL